SVLDRFEPLTTAYWDYVAVVLYYKDLSLTGYAVLYCNPFKIARNELELSVFVAPEYQNLGIGKLLIKQAINVAKSFDSVDEVTIMVKRKLGLEGYYKKQGFSCSSSSDNSFSMSMEISVGAHITNCLRVIRNAWHFHYALVLVFKVVCGSIGIVLLTP
ncbi:GNAT family N-acetyltransferase, partial [Vibrio parahaemolyticus]|uniref:GNAT family N-acetyltransferase n=1 Tax=Vibrio parahaemolyticus TaxID=670 RepID=UPI00111F984A